VGIAATETIKDSLLPVPPPTSQRSTPLRALSPPCRESASEEQGARLVSDGRERLKLIEDVDPALLFCVFAAVFASQDFGFLEELRQPRRWRAKDMQQLHVAVIDQLVMWHAFRRFGLLPPHMQRQGARLTS
jgi:hypothetical protein